MEPVGRRVEELDEALRFSRALLALCFAALFAGADAARSETLNCAPRFPVFCANVHVGCAGRTKLRAPGFVVDLNGDEATVLFDDGVAASAVVTRSHSGRVLRAAGAPWWIRIAPSGQFSQRIVTARGAAMSAGRCAPE